MQLAKVEPGAGYSRLFRKLELSGSAVVPPVIGFMRGVFQKNWQKYAFFALSFLIFPEKGCIL
jgi:hypothetical protein